MYQFPADQIVMAMNRLDLLRDHLRVFANQFDKDPSSLDICGEVLDFSNLLSEIGLQLSAKQAKELHWYLLELAKGQRNSATDVSSASRELGKRIQQELEDRHIFLFRKSDLDLLENPMGSLDDTSIDNFPGLGEEIENASRCLAFGQGEACVFHLMRAMEICVQGLAKNMCWDHVEKEWGKLLSDIDKKIELMEKGALRDKWSECHSNLYHVKQAWRNPTMHPKKTYTAEQASEVRAAVLTFVRQLSTLV